MHPFQCLLATTSDLPSWVMGASSPALQLKDSVLTCHLPKVEPGKRLSEVCTWGIGGPASLFCEVQHELQLASIIRQCSQQSIRFLVIGNGSNCLFDDRGFDGCIILNRIRCFRRLSSGLYHVGSGYPFNVLGIQCSKDGYTGLEFATCIPGTVGGAVYMNAGADGQETAAVLKSVHVVTVLGSKHEIQRAELSYGYRSSPFQSAKCFAAISGATFELGPSHSSREWHRNYVKRRKQTQPVAERTAGCVFKNPGAGCQSAGSLIDKAGLKGVSIGGAKVSELHANFFVNMEGASAKDMLRLISYVKEQVKLRFGVNLQEEIVYVPYD